MNVALHVLEAKVENKAKSCLKYCQVCRTSTLHTRAVLILPYRCVANHGGQTKCDNCGLFVEQVAKVIVRGQHEYSCLCEVCAQPDSPDKEAKVKARQEQAAMESQELDPYDATSVARALGASSFVKF